MSELNNYVKIPKMLCIFYSILCAFFIIFLMSNNSTLKCLYDSYRTKVTRPTVIAITSTQKSNAQVAELTRLSQTVMLVHNIHWVVVEDGRNINREINDILHEIRAGYSHIVIDTEYRSDLDESSFDLIPEAKLKNAGLQWVRRKFDDGIVFFMDEGNTYSMEVFNKMRRIKKVGVWAVGLADGVSVDRPLLDADRRRVVGFSYGSGDYNEFPLKMSGFAVHVNLLKKCPNARFTNYSGSCFHGSDLLEQMVSREDLEPLGSNCSRVLVWNTKTET